MKTDARKLVEYFNKLNDPVFMRRSAVKSLYNRYNTDDVHRLYSKLSNPDFSALMVKADKLMSCENISMFEPKSSNWTEDILTHMHYNTEVEEDDFEDSDRQTEYERRKDIIKWRDAYSDILGCYSWERLDLSWDLAWSFYVSYRKNFRQGHLKVYASIIGEVPKGLDGIPYQSILTSERKLRQRRRKNRIAKAILAGDRDSLLKLNLTDEEIDKAFERARSLMYGQIKFDSSE